MTRPDPIPYSDAQIRSILRTGQDDRDGRRLVQLEPAQLLRDEVPAGQRLPRHPGQSRHRRPGAARRDASTPRCATSPSTIDMVDMFRASDRGAADRRGRDRDRRPGGVDAARHPQRRGGGDGRGSRHRSDHEPLPEDRVRPPGRRTVVERRQLRHHPEPRAASRRSRAQRRSRAAQPSHNRQLRLRDAAPSMPAPRPIPTTGARIDADLPDHGLCVRRCRSRRLALQPAQFRLHLLAPDQPDRRGAGGARRQPGRRPRRASPPPRATRRSS